MIPFTTTELDFKKAKSLARDIKHFCFLNFDVSDTDNFEIYYLNGSIEIIWLHGFEYDDRDLMLIQQSLDYIVRTYGEIYLERDEQYVFKVELPHFHLTVSKCTEIENTTW